LVISLIALPAVLAALSYTAGSSPETMARSDILKCEGGILFVMNPHGPGRYTGLEITKIILLFLCIAFSGGCLFAPPSPNAVHVEILTKEINPGALGECSYHTVLAVTNEGSSDIRSLAIIIELYDPDTQKVAARESVAVGELHPGEVRNITSTLQTHCRQSYTIRAYAQF
jgi:hypothetical protein